MASSSSSPSLPLVPNGVEAGFRLKKSQPATTCFPTTTPPVIRPGTIVVAAAAPNIRNADPVERDGWFLSDFYAFNYLLKGVGGRQVWLTAADPRKLIQPGPHFERFLHGNPFQERKVVLSKELLDAKAHTPVTVVPTAKMIDRFLKEVELASQQAVKGNVPLLLLVFCHGAGNWEFLLDASNAKKSLSVTRLQGVLATGCQTTLYSSACYSGGWVVRDLSMPEHWPLDITMLAAADPESESNSWQRSPSVGRVCGSIFASTVINTLISSTSPLLDDTEGDINIDKDDETQAQTYNKFCHSILDICASRVTRLAHRETFTFSAQADEWGFSWTARTGVPLAHFEERWNQLPTVPFDNSDPFMVEKKANLDPDPSNPAFSGDAGSSLTGGRQDAIESELIRSQINNQAAAMARTFLMTCPGDWDSGWGPLVRGHLEACMNKKEMRDPDVDVSALMAFRWEASLIADYMVGQFNLKAPINQTCLMWDRFAWAETAQATIPDYYEHRVAIWRALRNAEVKVQPSDIQGPPFVRFQEYLTAAVAGSGLSEGDAMRVVARMAEFMSSVRNFTKERNLKAAMGADSVIKRSRDMFRAVGRKFRHPFSDN